MPETFKTISDFPNTKLPNTKHEFLKQAIIRARDLSNQSKFPQPKPLENLDTVTTYFTGTDNNTDIPEDYASTELPKAPENVDFNLNPRDWLEPERAVETYTEPEIFKIAPNSPSTPPIPDLNLFNTLIPKLEIRNPHPKSLNFIEQLSKNLFHNR